ncbi:MAG: Carboxybiotin decarboxylase [Syntrophus sp. PtaB.Bin001]|nr:MAG: Carboxybiotin decarboxylase [Syntrophus sp. PtaB.Bin001]
MVNFDVLQLFQGIATLVAQDPTHAIARIVLMLMGIGFVYLGYKGILEALIMIPMGVGMAAVNASVLFLAPGKTGTIFLDPLITDPSTLVNILQINWLQPVYTMTFSNGLIACLVFIGIGVLCDIGYVLASPFTSMFIAIFAEMGSVTVFPLAVAFGMTPKEAAAVAIVGGADGPMVLFTSLMLSPHLFVPIGIVAYLYLSLCYGLYPFLIKAIIPKKWMTVPVDLSKLPKVTATQKIMFAVIACTILCLLFPVAGPLFCSFFVGIVIREAGVKPYIELIETTILYSATFFLGLILGVLCEAGTILNPTVLKILILGSTALLVSGIGGLIGGVIMYFISGKKFNPVIGIAGVSCVPTTAKVAQKVISKANPRAIVLPLALGANVSGVITTAILAGIYCTLLK